MGVPDLHSRNFYPFPQAHSESVMASSRVEANVDSKYMKVGPCGKFTEIYMNLWPAQKCHNRKSWNSKWAE